MINVPRQNALGGEGSIVSLFVNMFELKWSPLTHLLKSKQLNLTKLLYIIVESLDKAVPSQLW